MCNIPNAVNSAQLKVTPTELIKEHKGNRIKPLKLAWEITPHEKLSDENLTISYSH